MFCRSINSSSSFRLNSSRWLSQLCSCSAIECCWLRSSLPRSSHSISLAGWIMLRSIGHQLDGQWSFVDYCSSLVASCSSNWSWSIWSFPLRTTTPIFGISWNRNYFLRFEPSIHNCIPVRRSLTLSISKRLLNYVEPVFFHWQRSWFFALPMICSMICGTIIKTRDTYRIITILFKFVSMLWWASSSCASNYFLFRTCACWSVCSWMSASIRNSLSPWNNGRSLFFFSSLSEWAGQGDRIFEISWMWKVKATLKITFLEWCFYWQVNTPTIPWRKWSIGSIRILGMTQSLLALCPLWRTWSYRRVVRLLFILTTNTEKFVVVSNWPTRCSHENHFDTFIRSSNSITSTTMYTNLIGAQSPIVRKDVPFLRCMISMKTILKYSNARLLLVKLSNRGHIRIFRSFSPTIISVSMLFCSSF